MHFSMLLKCPEGLSLHVLDHILGGYPLIESLVYFLKTVVRESPPTQEEETPHIVSERDIPIGVDGAVHSRVIALNLSHRVFQNIWNVELWESGVGLAVFFICTSSIGCCQSILRNYAWGQNLIQIVINVDVLWSERRALLLRPLFGLIAHLRSRLSLLLGALAVLALLGPALGACRSILLVFQLLASVDNLFLWRSPRTLSRLIFGRVLRFWDRLLGCTPLWVFDSANFYCS